MLLAAITTPGDPTTTSSPLAALAADGLLTALAAQGAEVVARAAPATGSLREDLTRAAALGRALAGSWAQEARRPDVVLCDGIVAGLAGHAATAEQGVPVVVWTGSRAPTGSGPGDDPAVTRLAVAVMRSAALVCANCGDVAQALERHRLGRRIAVVPPAVDTAAFRDVGWHERGDAGRAASVVVAGHGEQAAEAACLLAADADADIAVVDVLDVAALRRALRAADVVVTGVCADGGRATLRAMASGRAVVCLDRLPDGEIVVDGASGVVLRRPDQVPATVGDLLRDPFRREALGQGALDRVQSAHAPTVVAQRLLAELASLRPT